MLKINPLLPTVIPFHRWTCPLHLSPVTPFWASLALLLFCGGCCSQWGIPSHLSTLGGRWTWQETVPGVVPPYGGRPACTGWTCNSDEQTPWEAAQVAAHAMLLNICQRFGDELTGGPTASIPRGDPAAVEWKQADGCALVRGRGERAESSSPTMSAMMAVLKLISQREDTYA